MHTCMSYQQQQKRGRGDYISAIEQKLRAFKIVTFINDTEHWN